MSKNEFPISIGTIITAFVVIMAAGYVMVSSFQGLKRTYMEEDWIVTKGTILSPDIELMGKSNIERKNQGFEQIVNYEYVIEGDTYQSNSASKEAYVLLDDFPEGKIVDVYYNPSDRRDTVLVRSELQTPYLYVIIGFCMALIGFVVYFLIRDIRGG